VVLGPWYDVIPQFRGHKGEFMKVSELIEILQDHRQEDEVWIAKSPARPFMAQIRGVVKTSNLGPVFILEDYGSKPLDVDLWRMLDE
jgi:hypothetical protein